MFIPSKQQQALFDWIETGTGSVILEALAGTGKTTTLVEALPLLKGKVFLGAYNKAIASELQERVPAGLNVKVTTMHAAGFGSLKKIAPNATLSYGKMRDIYRAFSGYDKDLRSLEGSVLDLVSYAKQSGIGIISRFEDDKAWENLIDHFNVDTQGVLSVVLTMAKKVLHRSNALCEKEIDFEDMIYYPLFKNAITPMYDWVLLDEGQDLNATRRLLALRLLKTGGRLLCVGDENQAIFGFTGADHDSLDLMAEATEAVRMPLSVTYRCPRSVVKAAQSYVPHLEYHEDAIEGVVRSIGSTLDMFDEIEKGDVILCRYNAPIVDLVYRFILRGMPAKIEGKDIGANLKSLANKWKSKDYPTFLERLQAYQEKETLRYKEQGKHYLIEALNDRVACLLTIIQRVKSLKKDGIPCEILCAEIDAIFGEVKSEGCITLSSIHRAKGKEWSNVYILTTDPSKRKLQDWEKQVEQNLSYVAITRAMQTLTYVPADNRKPSVKKEKAGEAFA